MAIRLAILKENSSCNTIQILIFLLVFPHNDIGAPVICYQYGGPFLVVQLNDKNGLPY